MKQLQRRAFLQGSSLTVLFSLTVLIACLWRPAWAVARVRRWL